MTGSDGALTGTAVGVYQVGEMLGAGQLAEVYVAQHPGLPQPVALKVFVPSVAAHTAYMEVMRETALRASLLKAPHILPIHGFAREGDIFCLATPLMHESLRSLLARTGPLPLARAVPLLRQIAQGVSAAHTAGIIHRDLKPENVLLDPRGQAFVSDFGVGRDLPPQGAGPRSPDTLSSLIGTPAYMAPEQLRGQPTDQRADVYALGVIFYEILTGAPPYRGNSIYEVAATALTTPIPPPSQHADGVTPLLERAILRALARDPADRWPTVQRFMVGLEAALPTLTGPSEAPEAAENGEDTQHRPPRRRATMPLVMIDGRVPGAGEDSGSGNTPPAGGSPVVVPDLRLFRVDPLPPLPARNRTTGLLLVGIALALLGILIAGGALLAHASQSPQSAPSITPTDTVVMPTRFNTGPQITPQSIPTAQPTHPPAPRPTATLKPNPKPTVTPTPPKPTVTPAPTASSTSTP